LGMRETDPSAVNYTPLLNFSLAIFHLTLNSQLSTLNSQLSTLVLLTAQYTAFNIMSCISFLR
jgi:hypothetical protein